VELHINPFKHRLQIASDVRIPKANHAISLLLKPELPFAVSSLGGFRTPAAEYAAPSLKRPASETLHNNVHKKATWLA
jgi:hypothetical protein